MQALGIHVHDELVAMCYHTSFVLLYLCQWDPLFFLLASFARKTICKMKEGGYVECMPIISPGTQGFKGVQEQGWAARDGWIGVESCELIARQRSPRQRNL